MDIQNSKVASYFIPFPSYVSINSKDVVDIILDQIYFHEFVYHAFTDNTNCNKIDGYLGKLDQTLLTTLQTEFKKRRVSQWEFK